MSAVRTVVTFISPYFVEVRQDCLIESVRFDPNA